MENVWGWEYGESVGTGVWMHVLLEFFDQFSKKNQDSMNAIFCSNDLISHMGMGAWGRKLLFCGNRFQTFLEFIRALGWSMKTVMWGLENGHGSMDGIMFY